MDTSRMSRRSTSHCRWSKFLHGRCGVAIDFDGGSHAVASLLGAKVEATCTGEQRGRRPDTTAGHGTQCASQVRHFSADAPAAAVASYREAQLGSPSVVDALDGGRVLWMISVSREFAGRLVGPLAGRGVHAGRDNIKLINAVEAAGWVVLRGTGLLYLDFVGAVGVGLRARVLALDARLTSVEQGDVEVVECLLIETAHVLDGRIGTQDALEMMFSHAAADSNLQAVSRRNDLQDLLAAQGELLLQAMEVTVRRIAGTSIHNEPSRSAIDSAVIISLPPIEPVATSAPMTRQSGP